ncbi:MAG: class I SAM-dependent methyltransferase [Pseudomonadota bacterium]
MDYAKVADLYDAYVSTTLDIGFFLSESKGRGRVLELMSGTGRVSIPLIEAGVSLTCVDSSSDMLRILREKLKAKGLDADVREADVCELSLGRTFDLIFIPFHSFSELVTAEEQRMALETIHGHLSGAGRFICTLHNPEARLDQVNGKLRLLGEYPLDRNRGKLVFSTIETYNEADRIVSGTQVYEIYGSSGRLESEMSCDLRFRLFSRGEFERLAASSGFEVERLYGDYEHGNFRQDESPFMIWVLGKGG